jgi:hypothetical protein
MSDEIRETGVESESGAIPEPLDELGLTYQELN